MQLHSEYVQVFFEWLEYENVDLIKSTNQYNPAYKWVWQGHIYWAYDLNQGLQIHSQIQTESLKEAFVSAIQPEETPEEPKKDN